MLRAPVHEELDPVKHIDYLLCLYSKCDSKLLNTVDNYAVLQLDIVWCYRALEALSYLDDGKRRLQMAEDCFHNCYGDQQQRLMKIKVVYGTGLWHWSMAPFTNNL